MPRIRLSLKKPNPEATPMEEEQPIAGYFAVGLGLLGIFTAGYIFTPLAFLASVIALFSGQILWAVFGLLLSFAGLLSSPVLLTFLGIAWMASIMGF